MTYKRLMMALLAGIVVLGLVAVPGCAANKVAVADPETTEESAATEPAADTRGAMIEAANSYFESEPVPTIAGADLLNIVNKKDDRYQLVDIRSAEHYALGHIEGSINIPYKTTADDESLAKLDASKKIVVICYTGHTAARVNMVWNMLGYDAVTLKFGMHGWIADESIVGVEIPEDAGGGYVTVSAPTSAGGPFDPPELASEYADVAEAIKGQAKAYFATGLAPNIDPVDVYEVVQSKDPAYQIVSVRKAEDYAAGHIDGAINILWTDIANNLDKIDPSKKVIIYCYTGHTGGEASMFLNLMGYEAYNMKFGMSGWNNDATMGGVPAFDASTVPGYPTVQ